MKISKKGLDFIKVKEGFVKKAYKDGFRGSIQLYSIGYGHQIQPTEANLRTATISIATANILIKKDLLNIENIINASGAKITDQSKFDALCSFGFNCGQSPLIKVLATYAVSGNNADTVKHMSMYRGQNTPTGFKILQVLVIRRSQEVTMFLTNVTDLKKKVTFRGSYGDDLLYYFLKKN